MNKGHVARRWAATLAMWLVVLAWRMAPAAPDAGAIDADTHDAAILDGGFGDGGPAGEAPPDAAPPDATSPDAAEIVPILEAVPDERPPPLPAADKPGVAIKAVLGLLAILVLAYVAAHPRARRLEQTAGLSSVVTAGFPFVVLGLIARQPAVGILNDATIHALTPLLDFGLGWIGFLVGLHFDVRSFDRLPRGTGRIIAFEAGLAFVGAALANAALVLLAMPGFEVGSLARSSLVLGTAAAMSTATPGVMGTTPTEPGADDGHLDIVSHLDEIAGVVGLLFLGAFFRPETSAGSWELPASGWLFVTLGLGATIGILVHIVLRRPATGPEFTAIALGSVAFAAGLANHLALSALVICFIAGVLIANLPNENKPQLRSALGLLERPIYYVFLVIAGAMWDVADWRGWALAALFVVGRFGGIALGIRLTRSPERDALGAGMPSSALTAPLGAGSIAVVVSARNLYESTALGWAMTAVLAGGAVFELMAQIGRRARLSAERRS